MTSLSVGVGSANYTKLLYVNTPCQFNTAIMICYCQVSLISYSLQDMKSFLVIKIPYDLFLKPGHLFHISLL